MCATSKRRPCFTWFDAAFLTADNCPKELNIGTFLKNLSETLVIEGCVRVLVILAGLPRLRDVLHDSHPSSLRLFEELELSPLSLEEVKDVIRNGIEESNKQHSSEEPVTIDDKILDMVVAFSEGYPHFVQQIGYSVFNTNTDNVISEADVIEAVFGKGGSRTLAKCDPFVLIRSNFRLRS